MSAPKSASMGSTAQRGGFGLGGGVGQGAVVPGQASPTPGVAGLSAQPLTTAPGPVGFSSDPAAQAPQEASPYAKIGNGLKSTAGRQQKQGQQKAGGMAGGEAPGGRPISLQQARAMFDSGKFYKMLRGAGVGAQSGS